MYRLVALFCPSDVCHKTVGRRDGKWAWRRLRENRGEQHDRKLQAEPVENMKGWDAYKKHGTQMKYGRHVDIYRKERSSAVTHMGSRCSQPDSPELWRSTQRLAVPCLTSSLCLLISLFLCCVSSLKRSSTTWFVPGCHMCENQRVKQILTWGVCWFTHLFYFVEIWCSNKNVNYSGSCDLNCVCKLINILSWLTTSVWVLEI